MGDLGAKLKQGREDKGLTLEDMFEETKIQVRLLKALEAEEFHHFPGEVYVKGALRNYANVVGLDYQELLSLYKGTAEEVKEEEKPLQEKEIEKEREIKKINIIRPPRKPRRFKPLLVFAIILLILVALVYVAGLLLDDRDSRDPDNGETPVLDDPAEDPEEDPEPDEEPGDEEPVPEVNLEKPNPDLEEYVLTGVESLQLEITFKGDCWIRVWEDGERVSSGTHRRGQDYTFETTGEIQVRLGNPLGVESFTVNGLAVEIKDTDRPYNITIQREAR